MRPSGRVRWAGEFLRAACLASLVGCATIAGPAVLTGAGGPTARTELDSVRVVSLNVGMLPGLLGHDDSARAERIADRLLAEDRVPDVIVLLELFDEDARDVFTERLRARYPFIVRHAGGTGLIREDSGLFLASRAPFVGDGEPRIGFAAFDERGPVTRADSWCDKGVLGVEIDLGARRSLCLFTAHLVSDYSEPGENAGARAVQLAELERFTEQFVAGAEPSRATLHLLVGDLNVRAESADASGAGLVPTREYPAITRLLHGAADLFRIEHPADGGCTWNHDRTASGADPALPEQRLDYALRLDGVASRGERLAVASSRTSTLTLAPGLTDHRAISVELAMAPPGPADAAVAARPALERESAIAHK